MPQKPKKHNFAQYRKLATENLSSRIDLSKVALDQIEYSVTLNGENVPVDTIMSYCRRKEINDSASRLIYIEFEALVKRGVIPRTAYAVCGNRRFFPTAYLDRVAMPMKDDLEARLTLRKSGNKTEVAKIANKLAKNPELTKLIAELIAESKV